MMESSKDEKKGEKGNIWYKKRENREENKRKQAFGGGRGKMKKIGKKRKERKHWVEREEKK